MRLEWTFPANNDLLEILEYIWQDNPDAAVRMDAQVHEAAQSLLSFPNKGQVGRIPGTRELFITRRYKLIYEVDVDVVRILTIIHTARQWPPDC